MAALVVIAVVAAVFAIRCVEPHRTPILAERGWVLISDFETSGDESIPDESVREGLTIALQQSRYINVFPRSRAYEVLQRMKKERAAPARRIPRSRNLPAREPAGIAHRKHRAHGTSVPDHGARPGPGAGQPAVCRERAVRAQRPVFRQTGLIGDTGADGIWVNPWAASRKAAARSPG